MMKRIKHLYLLLIVLLAFSACTKEILDKKPLDVITDLDVWKSAPLIKTYINGIYPNMDFTYVDQADMNTYPWQITEALYMDDTSGPGFGGVPKFGSFTAESGWINWWGYDAIRQMNLCTRKVTYCNCFRGRKKELNCRGKISKGFLLFPYDQIIRRGPFNPKGPES